jgi:hypothetical protein
MIRTCRPLLSLVGEGVELEQVVVRIVEVVGEGGPGEIPLWQRSRRRIDGTKNLDALASDVLGGRLEVGAGHAECEVDRPPALAAWCSRLPLEKEPSLVQCDPLAMLGVSGVEPRPIGTRTGDLEPDDVGVEPCRYLDIVDDEDDLPEADAEQRRRSYRAEEAASFGRRK